MEVFAAPARELESFGSAGVRMVRAALVEQEQDGFAVDVVRIAPGGSIGRHPTRLWQLFLVVEGRGWVSGADDRPVPVEAGTAASWSPGEEHGAGSADGMLAVVVQCRTPPLEAP
ncbi:cupin domain-containing protein [Geodermatophilus sp. CPCC 206100]|uniref:cupin domain-containing protein n=1 Tax=Geodermatophilus sp. CPCC 206100 TaxID=3020054 RepID=UPI003B001221